MVPLETRKSAWKWILLIMGLNGIPWMWFLLNPMSGLLIYGMLTVGSGLLIGFGTTMEADAE